MASWTHQKRPFSIHAICTPIMTEGIMPTDSPTVSPSLFQSLPGSNRLENDLLYKNYNAALVLSPEICMIFRDTLLAKISPMTQCYLRVHISCKIQKHVEMTFWEYYKCDLPTVLNWIQSHWNAVTRSCSMVMPIVPQCPTSFYVVDQCEVVWPYIEFKDSLEPSIRRIMNLQDLKGPQEILHLADLVNRASL